MARTKKILIVCGEPSADILAAELVRKIKSLDAGVEVSAVGGQALEQAGAKVFYDIKDLAVMGFFDALKKLPVFISLKKTVLDKIRQEKPQLLVLVDFSGFNLRLAKAINRKLPVIYYVSPQVWASRRGRIKTIRKYIAQMIVLFKFEEQLYKAAGIPVYFSGHPLLEMVRPGAQKEDFFNRFGLSPQKTTIALLPGSRRQEIKIILPLMLKSARLITAGLPDTQFVIAKSAHVAAQVYRRLCAASRLDLKIIENRVYDCLNACDLALVCSGSATLEAALLQKPFLIVYKMGWLNYLLYRPQIRIPYIGLVNIAAGKKIIPEFIQFNARPKKIAEAAVNIIKDAGLKKRMTEELSRLKCSLGETGASSRAAAAILKFLN